MNSTWPCTVAATVVLLLFHATCSLSIDAGGEYRHIAVLKGDTVLMWCNTTKSGGVNWTRNTTAGHFSYVYTNGRTTEDNTDYSVVEHSLRIYNAQIRDTGRYDCYDSGDVRRFGYELHVTARPDRYYYRTVHVGQTVKFPCETKLREDVNWKRMDIVDYIYLWGNMEPGHDPRITVDKNSSYTLTILNVTAEDSVSYRCAEDDGLGSKRYYGLTVTETPLEYTHVDMFTGETVTLSCNTSADDVMWTYDTNDGYVDYIYWNQLVDNDKRRLSVNVTANDFHNLIISDVHVDDSGRYDCYDNSGVRVVGYQLTVNPAVIESKTVTGAKIAAYTVVSLFVITAIVIFLVIGVICYRRHFVYTRALLEDPNANIEDQSNAFIQPTQQQAKHVKSIKMRDKMSGVTQLDDIVYVVCRKSPVIKTFTADTLSPRSERIHVEGMSGPRDIVACHQDRQLYIADWDYCIWRVSVDDHEKYVKWLAVTEVYTLSLTESRLLVTPYEGRLRQYSTTDKQLLSEVKFQKNVKRLYHAVETTRGCFVVGYRIKSVPRDKQFVVSEVNSGAEVLRTFVDVNEPYYLSVDRQGRVLVADWDNDRIVQLNGQLDKSKLQLECVLIDRKDPRCGQCQRVKMRRPERFYYSEDTSRLYVIHRSNESFSLFTISYAE